MMKNKILDENEGKKILIGIDAGGTKTDILIEWHKNENLSGDDDLNEGKVRKKWETQIKGGNLTMRSYDEVVDEIWTEIRKGLAELKVKKNETKLIIALGLAGMNSEQIRQDFEKTWQEKTKTENWQQELIVVNDILIGLLSSEKGVEIELPVIAQIIGTGGNCIGISRTGAKWKVGGIDYVGDQGSGFEIGYQCLRAAIADFDGREEKTILTNWLKESLKITNWADLIKELCPAAEGWKKSKIANITDIVLSEMEKDENWQLNSNKDLVLEKIIRQAVHDNFRAIQSVIRNLGLEKEERINLVWIGGIIHHHPIIRDNLVKMITEFYPQMTICLSDKKPVLGAINLAKLAQEDEEKFTRLVIQKNNN